MRGGDDAERLRQLEGLIEFLVVDSECALVGEKDFEAATPGANDLAEVRFALWSS